MCFAAAHIVRCNIRNRPYNIGSNAASIYKWFDGRNLHCMSQTVNVKHFPFLHAFFVIGNNRKSVASRKHAYHTRFVEKRSGEHFAVFTKKPHGHNTAAPRSARKINRGTRTQKQFFSAPAARRYARSKISLNAV